MMSAPYALAAAVPQQALPAPPSPAALPAWHSLIEERWQQRLSTLTELLAEPETRYCARCIAASWVALAG
jgi:hypothetical protein